MALEFSKNSCYTKKLKFSKNSCIAKNWRKKFIKILVECWSFRKGNIFELNSYISKYLVFFKLRIWNTMNICPLGIAKENQNKQTPTTFCPRNWFSYIQKSYPSTVSSKIMFSTSAIPINLSHAIFHFPMKMCPILTNFASLQFSIKKCYSMQMTWLYLL